MPQGKVPFLEWLFSLDQMVEGNIWKRLIRLSNGNFGDYKYLLRGIYELRIKARSAYRLYFGKWLAEAIVVLNGGNKRTQGRDIEKAQKYWLTFKENHG